jgi:hypothetical protein
MIQLQSASEPSFSEKPGSKDEQFVFFSGSQIH